MKSAWSLLLLCLTVTALILLAVNPSVASDKNKVALVVDFGNGQVATRCVTFAEETITGFEALQRSGLPVETDFQTGGAAVCRIDGRGCPSDDCFCECRGGDECKYWSYWHFIDGTWNYSVAGSGIYQVRSGAVDGWVWGLGSITQAVPPPEIPFGEICLDGDAASPTSTSTSVPTSTPMILPTRAPTESAPITTPTMAVAIATEPFPNVGSPAAPPAETAEPSPSPAVGSQIGTPVPEVLIGENQNLSSPSSTGAQSIESNPSELDNNGPTSYPVATAMPMAITLQSDDGEPEQLPVTESTTELSAGIGLRGDNTQQYVTVTPTPTPVTVAAVVGMDAAVEDPLPGPLTTNDEVADPWVAYTGFAALLVLLGALALLVHRQRRRIRTGAPGET